MGQSVNQPIRQSVNGWNGNCPRGRWGLSPVQSFLLYPDSLNGVESFCSPQDSLNGVERIPRLCSGNSADTACRTPRFELSWSHYLLPMCIEDPVERNFYEREAKEGR